MLKLNQMISASRRKWIDIMRDTDRTGKYFAGGDIGGLEMVGDVAGAKRDSLQVTTLAATGVDQAEGKLEEWLTALQHYRHAQKRHDLSCRAIRHLVVISQMWAGPREWVSEIGLLCRAENETALTLAVMTTTIDAPVEYNLETCKFGLAVGGWLNLTVEPRLLEGIITDKPGGWIVAYTKCQNANKR